MNGEFTHEDRFEQLDKLSDWQLVNDDQDLRGRELHTPFGVRLGKIEDMLVDKEAEKVFAFRLDDGHIGAVERLEIRKDQVVYHPEMPEGGHPHYVAKRGNLCR